MKDLVELFRQRQGAWVRRDDDRRQSPVRVYDLPEPRGYRWGQHSCANPECRAGFWAENAVHKYCSAECRTFHQRVLKGVVRRRAFHGRVVK